MLPRTPSRYLPLHLLIDQDPETPRHFIRILPPAPAFDSFRDAMFRLSCEEPFLADFRELPDRIGQTLQDPGADLGESGLIFEQIRCCGEWMDKCLRRAASELRDCLRDSLDVHNKIPGTGVLILLHFGEHATDLSKLVWEAWNSKLGGGHDFLLKRDWVSLVRFVPGQGRPRKVETDSRRMIRLLVTTSSFKPKGGIDDAMEEYIQRDRNALLHSLDKLIRTGVFAEPVFLANPTFEEPRNALQEVDIYHHFGHGGLEGRNAFLMLKDSWDSLGRKVFWHELQDGFLTENAPHLKLVVLNACELQRAGLGTRLARLGVPAVIVMQAEIDARVIADRGFTQSFYTHIAHGAPVHAAFSQARSGIWNRFNCVESFVPVLILSTLDDLVFHRDHDWDEAVALEESGQIEAALACFQELARRRPDDARVQDRIASLQGKVERQRRVHALVEQLQRAISDENYGRLQDLLRDTAPLAQEPALAAALERWTHELAERLERLQREKHWLEAHRLLLPLQALAAQLPEERRPPLPADRVESQARQELERRRETLQQMWRRKQYAALIEPARQYLEWEPDNRDVRQWLREAQDIAQLADQITLDDEPRPAGDPYAELHQLFASGDWQRAAELGRRLMDQLPPAHRDELSRLMLSATAQQQRSLGDWATVKEASREMLRLDPEDAETGSLLQEALRQEAESFCQARRWEEAEADCRELLQRTPEDDRAWQLLSKILIGQAEEARRRHDWERVQEVSQRILGDANLKRINERARKLKEEADDALRLLKRIRLL